METALGQDTQGTHRQMRAGIWAPMRPPTQLQTQRCLVGMPFSEGRHGGSQLRSYRQEKLRERGLEQKESPAAPAGLTIRGR